MGKKDKGLGLEWVYLIPVFAFGIMGALMGWFVYGKPLEGLFWGIVIGLTIIGGDIAKDWIGKRMNEGKLFAYILVGVLASVAICGYLALTLGNATCIDRDPDARMCNEYADNGFSPSTEQRWAKFWGSLPVTTTITVLIAALVHSKTHEKKR